MITELGLFSATDHVQLPGLLFTPDKSTSKVLVWLHGMGDSAVFYSPARINALAEALNKNGIAFFAFNNRGAHNNKTLKQDNGPEAPEEEGRYQGGTHYELIKDCVKDIDGAVNFLQSKGFNEFYLAGHSTGANKICVYYHYAKKNPFSKYILAGPGDDSGLAYDQLGDKKFWSALKYAAKEVSAGNNLKVMPKYTGMYPFSTQSAWDILNPDGDYNTFPFYEASQQRLGKKPLFEEYKNITKPTLVIFGSDDEYAYTAGTASSALDLFIKHTSNTMLKQNDFRLVHNADHGFTGHEEEFAEALTEWVRHG